MKFKELKQELNISFLILSILVGVLSALFTYCISFAEKIFINIYNYNSLLVFIYTPGLFTLTVFLLKKYFPYADGSGLPQGYAVDIFTHAEISNIYSIKTAIGKMILTFLSILAGASLGKEGPTIQICASLFASIKNITDEKRRLLIKLGAGVGVAAAFNTPIAGMIFTIEEYVKKLTPHIATLLVGGTLLAVFFSNLVSGSNSPYIGFINSTLLTHNTSIFLVSLIIGIVTGLCGAIFTKIMVFLSVNKNFIFNKWRKKHYILNAILFGLLVAIIGYFSNGLSFGNGANTTTYFINSTINAPWYYGLTKALSAIASVSSGVPGGYFSTALSIGAGIGDLIHLYFQDIPLVQFYLLGMAGFLASITQSPITAVAMIVEMSNSSTFSLPILLACFIASIISEQFGDSVYHQQVLNYIDKPKYHQTI